MRKFAALLLFPVIAFAAVNVRSGATPARHFTVVPIRIEPKPGDPGQIRGQFELKASPQAQSALLTGGACMVRQFYHAKTCTQHSDCDAAAPGGTLHGYCANAPGAAAKSCWYKPPGLDTVMCKKSPVAPLPKKVPLYTPWVAVGERRPVSWRIVTCQNVVAGGCAKWNGVQGVDYIQTYGVPRHYPALPPVARPGGG
jgi:hypothetical protein